MTRLTYGGLLGILLASAGPLLAQTELETAQSALDQAEKARQELAGELDKHGGAEAASIKQGMERSLRRLQCKDPTFVRKETGKIRATWAKFQKKIMNKRDAHFRHRFRAHRNKAVTLLENARKTLENNAGIPDAPAVIQQLNLKISALKKLSTSWLPRPDFKLSSLKEPVVVPDVAGLTFAQAEAKLAAVDLICGRHPQFNGDKVARQGPVAGTQVLRGRTIWVALGPR